MTKKSPYFERLTTLHDDGGTAPAVEVAEGSKEKVPFDPWADLTPKGTSKVNVNPKPPGRNRVHLHTGRSSRDISLKALKSLEGQIRNILSTSPELSEEEVISAIHSGWKANRTPRAHKFGDSTIRNLVRLQRQD